jgi:protein tyrosine phosphatase (PTP) superfamily phosphohydrolase (DUF442 family)
VRRVTIAALALAGYVGTGGRVANAGVTGVETNITNGVTGPGHVDVDLDEYGSFGLFLGPNFDDHFQPFGSVDREATSIDLQYMFLTTTDAKVTAVALSDSKTVWTTLEGFSQATGVTGDRTAMTRVITQANTRIAANEIQSKFQIVDATVPAVDLEVSVDQKLVVNGQVTVLQQDYAIQNASSSSIDIVFDAQWDLDLSWSGPGGHAWFDDVAGVGTGLCYVYQQEPGSTTEALALADGSSDVPMTTYYTAKDGVAPPDNGTPPYMSWLEHQIWDLRGVPASWRDSLANVGYDVAGDTGMTPGNDAMIGTEYAFTLPAGATRTIRLRRHYGTVALPCVQVGVNCGDGNMDAGEACDSGGADTAACNGALCTLPACGDNYVNTAAGETCESNGVDSATCNGGTCTTPVCGDGYVNAAAGEDCESGPTCDLTTCTTPGGGSGSNNAFRVGGGCAGCRSGDAPGTCTFVLVLAFVLRRRPASSRSGKHTAK